MENMKGITITVMVSDMDRAVAFYTQTLGLPLHQRYGDHYAEIQAPGMRIGLHPASPSVVWGNNLSIGFGVEDWDLSLQHLAAQGIEVRIEQDNWGRIAYFSDPDNNALYLVEMQS
jgi:predicted enzyme related to lactoylglutathione lyase